MPKYETRLRQAAKIRLGLAAAIVVVVAVFSVWPNYQELRTKSVRVEMLQSEISAIETKLEAERDIYRALKTEYGARAATDQRTITAILPETAEQTKIVRELEAYTNELAGKDDSLILSSINFGRLVETKDVDHITIPLKVNFVATKEKLMAFLRYLERTGNIVAGNKASRLLDVQEVNLQVKDRDSDSVREEINVDLSVNAYALPSILEGAPAKK
ncbi:MAG: hypothetical protein ABIH35_02665 [Patescibacteria group bacterium]